MFEKIASPILNTVAEVYINEQGEQRFYKIHPADGYKLHVKELDEAIYDELGRFVENKKGYTKGFTTCPLSYNFEANRREIYSVKEIAYGILHQED